MTAEAQPAEVLVLRDGLKVALSPVMPEDEPALWEFLTGLSTDSRRLRFFSAGTDLRREAHRGALSSDADHYGLLATAGGRGVVGHAVYVRASASPRAEVAVEVADDLHHQGLATLMVIRLAQAAEDRHITELYAEVLPENRDMLAVFRDGFAAETVPGQDAIQVVFSSSGWRAAQQRFG